MYTDVMVPMCIFIVKASIKEREKKIEKINKLEKLNQKDVAVRGICRDIALLRLKL